MGACNIDFEINKEANFKEVEQVFEATQLDEYAYNGHQYGYSGDFQTVDYVKNCLHMEFNDYDKAYDYCLEKAEKWEYVVAVRLNINNKKSVLVAGWGGMLICLREKRPSINVIVVIS